MKLVQIEELKEGDVIIIKTGENRTEIVTVTEVATNARIIGTVERGYIDAVLGTAHRLGTKEVKPEIFLKAENITPVLGKYWEKRLHDFKHKMMLDKNESRILFIALNAFQTSVKELLKEGEMDEDEFMFGNALLDNIRAKLDLDDYKAEADDDDDIEDEYF